MTLIEMVESAVEAFDSEVHRKMFRVWLETIVTMTVAHLHAEGMLNDRECHVCGAHVLVCPSCDADEFAKRECDRCGMLLSCENCEESCHG